MGPQRLRDLVADADHRMKRRGRVLEDHADRRAADLAHPLLGDGDEVHAFEPRVPAGLSALKQPHERHRRRRLAASALADKAKRFACVEREGDTVDGLRSAEGDCEILDREKTRRAAHRRPIFGSSASRSPSPMKLKLVTASVIASPGMTASQGSTKKSL